MVNLQDKKANREKVLKAIKNANRAVASIDEIAKVTKLSRQTVSKHIDVLCAEGKINVFKTVGKINLYEAVK